MKSHPSLWRPVTVFGVEILTLAGEIVVASAVTVMGGVHPFALLGGVCIAALLHTAALAVTRVDGLLPSLYLRSLRHPDYLPARSQPWARPRRPAVSVPGR
jgi:type IV secretory pathway TrbD component